MQGNTANVDKDTKDTRKVMKLEEAMWALMSHEAIDRRCRQGELLMVACRAFLALPVAKREKLVRESESQEATNAA